MSQESLPANADRYEWTARERDADTGLQYNRARSYDPTPGLWLPEEPIAFLGGDANLYRYVGHPSPEVPERVTAEAEPPGLHPLAIPARCGTTIGSVPGWVQ